MRSCPRCTWPLSAHAHDNVELDVCRRCGGVFLDPGEAAAVFGEAADPAHWTEEYNATDKGEGQLSCPTGHAALTVYEVAFGNQKVEVDVCPRCRGLWLDKNEGTALYNIVSAAREHADKKALGLEKPGLGLYVFQLLTGFPIEVWNPVKKKPVVMHALVAILIVLFIAQFAAMVALGDGFKALIPYFWAIPVEVVHFHNPWTLITCGFFHGGFMHILGNLYFLWIFGDNVEDELGHKRFIILYAISLVAGSALHVLFNIDSTIPMLGASGAISGVMGAYLVLFPKVRLWVMFLVIRLRIRVVWYLGVWIAYQVLMGFSHEHGVAFWAHAGGFFAGAGYALMAKKKASETPARAIA